MTELPVDQVRTLLAVADEGTFDAAAAVLHVTPSAVSQRIKALEQRTGRVLLQRTKPVRLTESGRVVVRFARQLTQLERDARAELGMTGADEPARLSIAVNADSLATWLLPALARVPDVCFELHREDEGRTAALLREGLVMAAVTSTPDPVQGCSVRKLGHLRYLACASPALDVSSLRDTPVVLFDRNDELQDRFAGGASAFRHYMPSAEAFLDAIVAGLGWGMVPCAKAAPHLAAGTLVSLDPDHPVDVPLYWQQWKLDSPALAATAAAVFGAARTLNVPDDTR
jgi:LysR family transcriptional regulator, chromosome initiation inhibitor